MPKQLNKKRIVFSTIILEQRDICMQLKKAGPLPHAIQKKINSKGVKDLNVSIKVIKLKKTNKQVLVRKKRNWNLHAPLVGT